MDTHHYPLETQARERNIITLVTGCHREGPIMLRVSHGNLGAPWSAQTSAKVSFQELLTVEAISVIDKRATGEKYLVNPSQG